MLKWLLLLRQMAAGPGVAVFRSSARPLASPGGAVLHVQQVHHKGKRPEALAAAIATATAAAAAAAARSAAHAAWQPGEVLQSPGSIHQSLQNALLWVQWVHRRVGSRRRRLLQLL